MATPGPALSHRARLSLYRDGKVLVGGVRAGECVLVWICRARLVFFATEVCGLLGESSPLLPLAWNVLQGGEKKAIAEPPSTTFMRLKVGI